MTMSTLDPGQIVKSLYNETTNSINIAQGLTPGNYDYLSLTYVPSGNGAGEIQTVTYKTGGSSGVTLSTLTFTYDSSNNISSVTKS